MKFSFNEIFEVVRSVVSVNQDIPPEEITLESHLYDDLGVDSLDVVEIILTLEQEFDLPVPDEVALNHLERIYVEYMDDAGEMTSEGRWNMFRVSTNASLQDHLNRLEFSKNLLRRAKEVEEFSRHYNVQPFSIGCLCACVMHISQAMQELISSSHRWMDAWQRRDRHVLELLMSSDFISTNYFSEGAIINRAKWLDYACSHYECRSFSFEKIKVRLYGNTAIVNSLLEQAVTAYGKDWSGLLLLTDVWVKRGGGWQVVSRHSSLPPTKDGTDCGLRPA